MHLRAAFDLWSASSLLSPRHSLFDAIGQLDSSAHKNATALVERSHFDFLALLVRLNRFSYNGCGERDPTDRSD